MSFYDFLWSSVRSPKLMAEYAKRAGLDVEVDEATDFYERLRQIAILSVMVFTRETAQLDTEVPQAKERCREIARFVLEALQDLREAGRSTEGIEVPKC